MGYTEKDILKELDQKFKNQYNAKSLTNGTIQYFFFLDLEHGYCETAGSRIHLYADSANWAIVFEKSGYYNRGDYSGVELNYIGNCIEYIVENYNERSSITNSKIILLIAPEEYERINDKIGADEESFELIDASTEYVNVRNEQIEIEYNSELFVEMGVVGEFNNPRNLMSYGGLIRYIEEKYPSVIQSSESEITTQLPHDIPKIMTIDEFYYSSVYETGNLPSSQELFQLIAKILVSKDSSLWKPIQKPNNHWSNWESGNL